MDYHKIKDNTIHEAQRILNSVPFSKEVVARERQSWITQKVFFIAETQS